MLPRLRSLLVQVDEEAHAAVVDVELHEDEEDSVIVVDEVDQGEASAVAVAVVASQEEAAVVSQGAAVVEAVLVAVDEAATELDHTSVALNVFSGLRARCIHFVAESAWVSMIANRYHTCHLTAFRSWDGFTVKTMRHMAPCLESLIRVFLAAMSYLVHGVSFELVRI